MAIEAAWMLQDLARLAEQRNRERGLAGTALLAGGDGRENGRNTAARRRRTRIISTLQHPCAVVDDSGMRGATVKVAVHREIEVEVGRPADHQHLREVDRADDPTGLATAALQRVPRGGELERSFIRCRYPAPIRAHVAIAGPERARVAGTKVGTNLMSTRRKFLRVMASTAVVGSAVSPIRAFAQERLALKGYDPVAYFTLSAPTPGVIEYEYVWDGVRYRFANAQHRELFKTNPEKYAPQFGGSCAMNMANGVRRESDPTIWVISNGNLYVFAGTGGAERFRQDAKANAIKALTNWKTLRDTPSQ
jgi:YHS domain-containing protein